MDRAQAIAELPLPYAVALRLREAAADPQTIARALDIEPEGVSGVLRIGEAKLAALLARADGREYERSRPAD
jgi:hypothetical protein